MAKAIMHPYIKFIGRNSTEVTGSCTLVRFLDQTILVDYGARQSSNDEEDYLINKKRHKDIKPKNITAIIVTHSHIDHTGLIPMLVKDGMNCPIYIPKGSKGILTLMWNDCVKIYNQEYERLDRQPLYIQEDVDKALALIHEVEIHDKCIITDNISFTYYNAQHIVKSRQVLLELNNGVNVKKIGFTGDWSNKSNTYYLNKFESLPQVDVLVAEATYANNKRTHKLKDRTKDIDKIKTAIQNNKGKILIPTFSLDRLQNILTTLYEIYDGHIPIKILIDSPLGKSVSNEWSNIIDENRALWDEVTSWSNTYWTKDFKDTLAFSKINEPMLICGSGGMLSGGRATYWAKELLGSSKNTIMFCGYATPESTAGKIKNGTLKEIKIDKTTVKNKAQIVILNSFSSHADYNELLDYYTNIEYNKICLVHSNQDDKITFAKELRKKLSKANRTSRVIATNFETKVSI